MQVSAIGTDPVCGALNQDMRRKEYRHDDILEIFVLGAMLAVAAFAYNVSARQSRRLSIGQLSRMRQDADRSRASAGHGPL